MAGKRHPGKFSEGLKRQMAEPCDNGKPAPEILGEYGPGDAPHAITTFITTRCRG